VTNPKVIVEVPSQGTEEYDRGEKLEHYRRIDSLEAIVLVDHRSPQVELWVRGGEDWSRREHGEGGRVELTAIGCALSVDAIYAAARDA